MSEKIELTPVEKQAIRDARKRASKQQKQMLRMGRMVWPASAGMMKKKKDK